MVPFIEPSKFTGSGQPTSVGKEEVDARHYQNTLDMVVQDDPVNGVYRVGRDIFTDPESLNWR